MLRRHCQLLRYRFRHHHHVFSQFHGHIPKLLWPRICLDWNRYPLRKFHERQLYHHSTDHFRVSTPSEVSPHLSPTSSCLILLEGSTLWHTETLYSCKTLKKSLFAPLADSQYWCHHFRQFQIIPHAFGRSMVDRLWLLHCCSLREDILGRDHVAKVTRKVHGCLELLLLWQVFPMFPQLCLIS